MHRERHREGRALLLRERQEVQAHLRPRRAAVFPQRGERPGAAGHQHLHGERHGGRGLPGRVRRGQPRQAPAAARHPPPGLGRRRVRAVRRGHRHRRRRGRAQAGVPGRFQGQEGHAGAVGRGHGAAPLEPDLPLHPCFLVRVAAAGHPQGARVHRVQLGIVPRRQDCGHEGGHERMGRPGARGLHVQRHAERHRGHRRLHEPYAAGHRRAPDARRQGSPGRPGSADLHALQRPRQGQGHQERRPANRRALALRGHGHRRDAHLRRIIPDGRDDPNP